MSLPSVAVEMPRVSTEVDPFGLWQPPAVPDGAPVSFGDLQGGMGEEPPAAVWSLSLSSEPEGQAAGEAELRRRAEQLEAIQAGLAAAGPRVERLLNRRAAPGVAFAVGEPGAEPLPGPEQSLAIILDDWEAGVVEQTGADASFGLGEDLSKLASTDWNALRQRLEALVDSVNRQILHYAWVETNLDGHLAARTTVNWGGDLRTLWQSGLLEAHVDAHRRSLELALASRLANLKTILTVSQIAGKIALAVTTPLGPLQAISLAWQFVHDVIMPMMEPTQ